MANYNTDKKPSYTVEQQLMAVDLIRKNGGKIDKKTIQAVRTMLNAPTINQPGLRNWWLKYKDTPPAEVLKKAYGDWITPRELVEKGIDPRAAALRNEAEDNVGSLFMAIAKTYLEHALKPEIIEKTKGRDAVWAAAVSIDKVRLLREVPKEVIDMLPSIIDLAKKKGLAPTEMFQQMYAYMLRLPDVN